MVALLYFRGVVRLSGGLRAICVLWRRCRGAGMEKTQNRHNLTADLVSQGLIEGGLNTGYFLESPDWS